MADLTEKGSVERTKVWPSSYAESREYGLHQCRVRNGHFWDVSRVTFISSLTTGEQTLNRDMTTLLTIGYSLRDLPSHR